MDDSDSDDPQHMIAAPLPLKDSLADPLLESMNFLNEVVSEFPAAISLAPGRPPDPLHDIREQMRLATRFVDYRASQTQRNASEVWRELGQYGRTAGLIGDLIAEHLRVDEGIEVDPEHVLVTVGAQEAMAIIMAGLFDRDSDVLLVSDPTYIGITGLARLFGVPVVPVPSGDKGLEPAAVEETLRRASCHGRVRALYDIPDFNNPLGTRLPLARREELLQLCARERILFIEDNAYGMYAYDGARLPTMKALDEGANVAYVGSFAKTLGPGLRTGYVVADRRVISGGTLAKALTRVKSLLTVNTPPLLQAVVGGALLANGCSLRGIVEPKRVQCQRNRDAMHEALRSAFHDCGGVSWSVPEGGFFLPVTLPFEFGAAELVECAGVDGVIVSPMEMFCVGVRRSRQIRLSFSYATPGEVAEGIRRLASFVRRRISSGVPMPVAAAVK